MASSLSFAAALYLSSSWNWAPVQLPIPGPGLSVVKAFDITTSGTFQFEASVPTASANMAMEDLPIVSSDLEASIQRNGATPRTYSMKRFRVGGRGSTDLYDAEPQVVLRSGSYTLRVQNKGASQPFGDRGALLTLTRFVHPTEFYLQGVLFRGLGWAGLLCGMTIGVLAELLARKRTPSLQ